MLEKILHIYSETEYDFRHTANPADPLKHLFPEWVDYYRLKSAIAAALQPRRILEIGVRFGYSGAAFLHGAPDAHYTGIDADTTVSGGCVGAIDWARTLLPADRSEIIRGDSQTMERFPGGPYDLIHIDGQQDGDGTYHDLVKAIHQARYILVDGYLWGDKNFQATNAFLYSYRDRIHWSITLGGYAGELLLEVKRPESSTDATDRVENSLQIRGAYDRDYYLANCGGWNDFLSNRGRHLSDPRLTTMLDLALQHQPKRLLDLGCGRGEITRQAARQGCSVEAIDYSADAIAIAREALAEEPELLDRIRLHCADASKFSGIEAIDAAIAGDIVEHLAPRELDEMYQRVAQALTPEGVFVVHTAPSLWFYRYHYTRQRREAGRLGLFLPPDPRSEYERQMHINEQSPRVLLRQLRQHFPHVLLWFASMEDPAGSLLSPMTPRQLVAQRDLYALASHTPIDRAAVHTLFRAPPVSESDVASIRLQNRGPAKITLSPSARSYLAVELQNRSNALLASQQPYPFRFAYHWLRRADRETVLFDGDRSTVNPASPAHSTRTYYPEFTAPSAPGTYILQMTLLQEGVRWFEWTNPDSVVEIEVVVSDA